MIMGYYSFSGIFDRNDSVLQRLKRTFMHTILLYLVSLLTLIPFSSTGLSSPLVVGQAPQVLTLTGDDGGKTDGSTWSSSEIKGKVITLFYVDPDKKSINEPLEDALKAQDFDLTKYGSIAVINMAATWLPNVAIESSLKKKQEQHPNTTYVKDKTKYLVKNWDFADDEYQLIIFDKEGKILSTYKGVLNQSQINEVIATIKAHL